MKPLDKKQLPQVIALAVLAAAFFGYFVMKMILPTPAAAGTQPAAPVASPKPAVKAPAAPADAAAFTAPPPSPGMHDPFVQGVSDQAAPMTPVPTVAPKSAAPAVRTASLKVTGIAPLAIPSVPALPSVPFGERKPLDRGGVPAGIPALPVIPAAPVAPNWTVTGVLQSGSEHVAILRSGDARRFVKQGDFVDSQFVVAAVTRDAVVLRHGHSRFTLALGGSKAVPVGAAAVRTAASPSAAGPASPQAAPDFTLSTPGGKPVSLASYRGRVVVLDFWASWCGWCLKGMPQIQTLYSRFGPKGLAVLSINSWDRRDAMQDFVQANPQYTTTMLYDPSPEAQSVASSLFGVKGIPYTVVIDRQGRVAAAFDGYSPDGEQRLEAVLSRLGLRRAAPEVARAIRSRFARPRAPRRALVAFAPQPLPLFASQVPALPKALKPCREVSPRRSAHPRVLVADYQSEKALPLFPTDAVHGLLPSGMEAPDFSLTTVSGESFSLSQLRGNAVVLGFWASWHAASVRSLAALGSLQNDLGTQGLDVVAVNSWDNKTAMQAALQGFKGSMTQLYDDSVSNASVAVSLYRVPDVPTFYVIDQEGRVAGAFVGYGRNTTGNIRATLARLGIVSQEKTL